jgi:tetratricopeptide (TPR) repeat protein
MKAKLERARFLHGRGRLAEAETLYREVLEVKPAEEEALAELGVLTFHQGRWDEARALFAQGVTIAPDSARLHGNLAEVLRTLGRRDEAAGEVERALALDPRSAQSWNVLGHLAHDQQRYDDAVTAFREAVRLRPEFVPGHINLGIALLALHRRGDAAQSLRTALQIKPDDVLALTKLGQALWELKDPDLVDEAETHWRRALALAPGDPEVLENLGQVLRFKGRFGEALEHFQRGLERAPRSVSIRVSIGELLLGCGRYDNAIRVLNEAQTIDPTDARLSAQLGGLSFARGRFQEATAHYRAAVALDPQSAEAHQGLGLALHEQGLGNEAECSYREAIRIDPDLAGAWLALARLQAERGDRDGSSQTARQVLALRPNAVDAYWRRADNLKGALPDDDIEAMRRLLAHRHVSHSLKAGLHFALGAVFDARGRYSEAAQHFDSANGLQEAVLAAKGQSFDPDQYARMIDRVIANFSSAVLARGRGWGHPDPRPVFVVGLPRSGTTLVEQILASHSQVHGAGELHDLIRVFRMLPGLVGQPDRDPFEVVTSLGPDSARLVAREYLAKLDRLAPPTASRIVDKMPDNFNLLGMIALLWTNARVIVCGRDPRDIALSCWQTSFATNPWTSNWEHIAQRIAAHERVLAHWRQAKPIGWLDIVYEELVTDLEGHARDMIQFLGLDWEPACLEFHKTRRIVRTASQWQVRQPIHGRSVGRWRSYEPAIQPFLTALKRWRANTNV